MFLSNLNSAPFLSVSMFVTWPFFAYLSVFLRFYVFRVPRFPRFSFFPWFGRLPHGLFFADFSVFPVFTFFTFLRFSCSPVSFVFSVPLVWTCALWPLFCGFILFFRFYVFLFPGFLRYFCSLGLDVCPMAFVLWIYPFFSFLRFSFPRFPWSFLFPCFGRLLRGLFFADSLIFVVFAFLRFYV